jgi:hypothetical protein
VLAVAPDTDLAYERLIANARHHGDPNATRRLVKRYEQAGSQFGFAINPYLIDEQGRGRDRTAR